MRCSFVLLFVAMFLATHTCAIDLKLELLADSDKSGAVCLDGSPGGYYYADATNAKDNDKLQIHLEGGGWCISKETCLKRSKTNLGSSHSWPATATVGGLLSSDCTINPTFCTWRKLFIKYCDGNSFSGNRTSALQVGDSKIYFRGDRIIQQVLRQVNARHNLKGATQVMLSGCSAGGLASILQANHVYSFIKGMTTNLKAFGVVPMSGIFSDHRNVEGDFVYSEQISEIFDLAQPTYSSGALHPCLRAYPSQDRWRCNMAQHMLPFLTPRVFIINSVADSWCIPCILTARHPPAGSEGSCGSVPGWADCVKNLDSCSPDQMSQIQSFANDVVSDLEFPRSPLHVQLNAQSQGFPSSIATAAPQLLDLLKPPSGSGAFLHTCYTHCEAHGNRYSKIKIGDVLMNQAVQRWWANASSINDIDEGPALAGIVSPVSVSLARRDSNAPHVYLPCEYNKSPPYQCNPTC